MDSNGPGVHLQAPSGHVHMESRGREQGQALLHLLNTGAGVGPSQPQSQPHLLPPLPATTGTWGELPRPAGPDLWHDLRAPGAPLPMAPLPGISPQRAHPPGFFPPHQQHPPPLHAPPHQQYNPLAGLQGFGPVNRQQQQQAPGPALSLFQHPHQQQAPPYAPLLPYPQQGMPPPHQQQQRPVPAPGTHLLQPQGGIAAQRHFGALVSQPGLGQNGFGGPSLPPPHPGSPLTLEQLLESLSVHPQQQQQQQPSPAPQSAGSVTQGEASGPGDGARPASPPSQFKPAQGREGRWVDVMDRSHDGRTPRCSMAGLDAALGELAAALSPSEEERASWMAAFDRVRDVLRARWPEGSVVLFGSVANGLAVRGGNDIDVCLVLDSVGDDAAAKSEVVEEAGRVLEEAGMAEVLALKKARVPVVKFTVPSTGTKVDITINNTLACINTKLLADYAAIDPRLAQLVAVVKHWAKRRSVNDPYRGTLSSYCYVLMCIHLLQTRRPPVLPVLQALPPTYSRRVRDWSCDFFDDVGALAGFGGENREGLASLVWAFFEYWAWRHNYGGGVVSVRTGGVLSKDNKDWTRRIGTERHLLCVEDPFELTHDLGRTVDPQTRDVLRKEFLRAATLLRDSSDPMHQLFEPYRNPKSGKAK